MWIKHWEMVSIIGFAAWCTGLSLVGISQYSTATYRAPDEPAAVNLGWVEPESSSSRTEEDLARFVELKISPPFAQPTPLKILTQWNEKDVQVERSIPEGVESFKIGFDLGPRPNLFMDEVVQFTLQPEIGEISGVAVHLARFQGMANKAKFLSTTRSLQGGVQEELTLSVELLGKARQDMDFPLSFTSNDGLIAADSDSLVIRKGEFVSEGVKVKILNQKVDKLITAVLSRPDVAEIELMNETIEIELLAKPLPIVTPRLSITSIDEGKSTTLNVSLSKAFDEDVSFALRLPSKYENDLQLAASELTISAGDLSAETTVTAVKDDIYLEPDETVSLEISTPTEVEITAQPMLTIVDSSSIPIILSMDPDAVLSEGIENQRLSIDLQLPPGAVAGSDISIPCSLTSVGAGISFAREVEGTDVIVSGVTTDALDKDLHTAVSGGVLINEGNNGATIDLLVIDDRVYMESESIVIDFELSEVGTLLKTNGAKAESRLSFSIKDNDNTFFKPISTLSLKESDATNEGKVSIASIECDVLNRRTLNFTIDSVSTAIEGKDYRLPNGGTAVINPGDKSLYLPLEIIDDKLPEMTEELRLMFDDPELGSIEITLADDDDPNALEDVGETLVILLANDQLAGDWARRKQECIDLLNQEQESWLISDSVFVVGVKNQQTNWQRLDEKRIGDFVIGDIQFGNEVELPSQLDAVSDAWDDIVERLNGRIPKQTILVWFNYLVVPDLAELKTDPFSLKGISDKEILSFVWYGGIVDGPRPIRFLPLSGTGLDSKVTYRSGKSTLSKDVRPVSLNADPQGLER